MIKQIKDRTLMPGDVYNTQLAYWKGQLEGIPPLLELPLDRPRPPVRTFQGAHLTFVLPKYMAEGLKALCKQEENTLLVTLIAVFQVLLYRNTGQERFLIRGGIDNRDRHETEPLSSSLINILFLRADLSGNPRFRELLARVRNTVLGAYEHQEFPFEELVKELQPQPDLSYNPLTQVMFLLMKAPLGTSPLASLPSWAVDIEKVVIQHDLVLHMYETAEGLAGYLDYSTELFDLDTIRRMLGHFQRLLESILAAPHQRVLDLQMLPNSEHQKMLLEWNDTGWDFPKDICLHELFEVQVEKEPEAIAVIFGEARITYGELDQRANQLAHFLRKLGVGPDVLVGLCVERSMEMVVGILGIMKAGGAYVPLDPNYPHERLTFMVRDTKTTVVLTQAGLRSRLDGFPNQVFCLDSDWALIAKENPERPKKRGQSLNLCYVIYTSGSTGTPKGIAIAHRGVVNNILDLNRRHGVGSGDRLLALSSLSFDMCVYEVFGTLEAGGAIVMPDPADLLEPAKWAQLMCRHQVTVWNSAPALLKMLVDYVSDLPDLWPQHLQLAILGGDWVPVSLPGRLKAMAPRVRFIVLGGATEASIHSIIYPVVRTDPNWKSIPYGKPQYNQKAYILNLRLEPIPIGVAGELYLGGIGLGRGYFNRPGLTAERFLPNPFATEPGERIYKTGDLARYMPDGTIELIGRADFQVKVRGLRIECGEIEVVILQHPGVREVVVTAKEFAGDKRLVAYVRPNPETAFPVCQLLRIEKKGLFGEREGLVNCKTNGNHSARRENSVTGSAIAAGGSTTATTFARWTSPKTLVDDIRAQVKGKLPDYMVPAVFLLLDEWPVSPNGKIDRNALAVPERTRIEGDTPLVSPRTPDEELLAEIWSKILRTESLGAWDNFFELGGHSLLATQVIARIRKAFGVELPLRTLFESPTIAELAERIKEARESGRKVSMPPLVPVPREGKIPLSFAPQGLWFVDQLVPGSPSYNIPLAFRLSGSLHEAALERSLGEILRRHEPLRTIIASVQGQPMQEISPPGPYRLPVIDLQHLPSTEREPEATRLAREEARRAFDLAVGPLIRTSLLRIGEQDHLLLVTMHHIIADGWSLGVFMKELAALYPAISSGQFSPLADFPIQYADYAAWQRNYLQGNILEEQIAYWKRQLSGALFRLEFPTDHPRPAVQTLRGARYSFTIPVGVMKEAGVLSRNEKTTAFITLLASFNTFLFAYTGQEDLLVGAPFASRTHAETEELIGPFVNTLVLRTKLTPSSTFRELLGQVREVVLGAEAHQDLSFHKIVEVVRPPRDLSRNPVFQVNFRAQEAPLPALSLPGIIANTVEIIDSLNSKFDLALELWFNLESPGGFFEYSTDLFEETTIHRICSEFVQLLTEVLNQPDVELSSLEIIKAIREQRSRGQILQEPSHQLKRIGLRGISKKAVSIQD